MLIQKLLKNHSVFSEIIPENAPLSTLRIITTLSDSKPICNIAEFFIGLSGEVISSIFAGGIGIEIDLQSGSLLAHSPSHSKIHPQFTLIKQATGAKKNFDGFQLPFFHEAVKLVEKAHAIVAPNIISIGWDVALLEDGPVILEGGAFAGSDEILYFNQAYSTSNKAILKRIASL